MKVLEINLKDADFVLEDVNNNQLATFLFYVKILISSGSADSRMANIKNEPGLDNQHSRDLELDSNTKKDKASL